MHGTKKDAQRAAAEMTLRPNRNAGGRKIADLLDDWLQLNTPSWAPLTLRDQTSRAKLIKTDAIAQQSVASVGVADIDRWVTRLRLAGVGESSVRNQHSVLRAALEQAVRWEWISRNPATNAPVKYAKRAQRAVMTDDDVQKVIRAAGEINDFAGLCIRLAAETGARRGELAGLRWASHTEGLCHRLWGRRAHRRQPSGPQRSIHDTSGLCSRFPSGRCEPRRVPRSST